MHIKASHAIAEDDVDMENDQRGKKSQVLGENQTNAPKKSADNAAIRKLEKTVKRSLAVQPTKSAKRKLLACKSCNPST